MCKAKIFSILLLGLAGCSFNPYDIPFIGWRFEVAAQQKHYQESLEDVEAADEERVKRDDQNDDIGEE